MVRTYGGVIKHMWHRASAWVLSLSLAFYAGQAIAIDVNTNFVPTLTQPTQLTTVEIEFVNNLETQATDLSLTNTLPTGVFVADTPNIRSTCGGVVAVTNTSENGQISLTGGVISGKVDDNEAVVCSILVDTFARRTGTFVNTISAGALSATQSGGAVTNPLPADATLLVTVDDFSVNLATSISSIGAISDFIQGGERRPFYIDLFNPNFVDLSEAQFSIPFPDSPGALIAAEVVQNECGGAFDITRDDLSPGANDPLPRTTLSLTGGQLSSRSSCRIEFLVEPTRDITLPGNFSASSEFEVLRGIASTAEGATNNLSNELRIRIKTGVSSNIRVNGGASTTINPRTNTEFAYELFFTNNNVFDISNAGFDHEIPTELNATSITANSCLGTASIIDGGGPNAPDRLVLLGGTLAGATELVNSDSSQTCSVQISVEPTTTDDTSFRAVLEEGVLGDAGYQYTEDQAFVTFFTPPTDPGPDPAVTVTKEFSEPNVLQGETLDLTFTISNTRNEPIFNLDIIDDLQVNVPAQARMRVGNAGVLSNNCPASISAVPNSGQIVIGDLSLDPSDSCELAVQLQIASDAQPGNYVNLIPKADVTYDMAGQTDLQIEDDIVDNFRVVEVLDVDVSYSPRTIAPGGISRLTIQIWRETNVSGMIDQLALSMTLPPDHEIAPQPDIENSCGGSVTAPPGSTAISLTGGRLDIGEEYQDGSGGGEVFYATPSCSITISVRAPNSVGSDTTIVNAGDVTARDSVQPPGFNLLQNRNSAQGDLDREPIDVQINKEFLTTTVGAGEPSRVRITILNDDLVATDLTGVGLTDDFSGTELRLADTVDPAFYDPNGSQFFDDCSGGEFTFVRGAGGSITLSGATMAQGAICYLEFNTTSYVSGNITNEIEAGGFLSNENAVNAVGAIATLTVDRELAVSKRFTPAVVEPGQESVLEVSLINATDGDISGNQAGPTLVDVLPAGMAIDESSISSTCSGAAVSVRSAAGGEQELVVSGGSFLSNTTCEISATVRVNETGSYLNTIPAEAVVTQTGFITNSFSTEATLRSILRPVVTKSFDPSTIAFGEVATLSFEITNPNPASILPSGLTGVSFSDPLTNMVLTSPPFVDLSPECGAPSITAQAGGGSFDVSGLALAADATCTVSVTVTSSVVGTHSNTTTGPVSDQTVTPGQPAPSVDLTVTPLELVTLTKSFVSPIVRSNTDGRLVLTLSNPNTVNVGIGPIGLTDIFPTSPGNMTIASTPNLTNTCFGTTVLDQSGDPVTAGDLGIVVTGGRVPRLGTCSIAVNVQMDALGIYTNTTSTLTTAAGEAPAASSTIEVATTPLIASASEAERNAFILPYAVFVGSVLGPGDQMAGAQATVERQQAGSVDLTVISIDPEISVDPQTALIEVPANTAAGRYSVVYQICEDGVSTNCAPSRTETVLVTPSEIRATTDYTVANPLVSSNRESFFQSVGNILGPNDTLNGVPVAPLQQGGALVGATLTIDSVVSSSGATDDNIIISDEGSVVTRTGIEGGQHVIRYTLCEIDDPSNCSTATEILEIQFPPITAGPEAIRRFDPSSGTINAGSVLSAENDTFDGVPAVVSIRGGAARNTSISLVRGDNTSPELSLSVRDGTARIARGSPQGVYTLEYQLCQLTEPFNCATAIETFVIGDIPIAAAAEADRAVTGSDAEVAAGSVLGPMDLLGNAPATVGTDGNVVLTAEPGADTDAELALDTDTGLLTVAAGTSAGTYTLEYQICDTANLSNCASAIETVILTDTLIVAAAEPTREVSQAATPVTAGSVLGVGDQLDSLAVFVGPGSPIVLTEVTSDAPLSLTPSDGLITVAENTTPGSYELTYQICEIGNADNCATAVETVEVAFISIQALAEPVRSLTGTSTAQTAGSVLSPTNDLVSGAAAVPGPGGNVVLTAVAGQNTSPELSLDPETGEITVQGGTANGTYTLQYQICEVGNLNSCATAIETVVITGIPIEAASEADRALRSLDTAQPGGNVLGAGDVLGAARAVPGAGGTVMLSAVAGQYTAPELSLDLETGEITVAANTPAGTYTIEYQICEAANLGNCATAIETVVVTSTPIEAEGTTFGPIKTATGGETPSVLLDDLLDGAIPTVGPEGTVVLTVVTPADDPAITLDPTTGVITVPIGTTPGTYQLTYRICEVANSNNCATAIETVVVTSTPIEAEGTTFDPIKTATGGETPSVLLDDLLDGAIPTVGPEGTVVLTVVTPADDPAITLDPTTGVITVPVGTPAGSYPVTYQICEAINLGNCATATETVRVISIKALPEDFPAFETDGGTTTSMLASDTVNGEPATLENVTLSVIASDDGVTLDPVTGLITLAPGLPAAQYTVTYEICDVAAPTSCDQAIETVTQFPIISIEATKTVEVADNGDGVTSLGDTVDYTIVVVNASNVALQNLTLTDTLTDFDSAAQSLDTGPTYASADQDSSEGSLLIGETATYTASVAVTVEMVTAGGLSNTVTVQGTADTTTLPDEISGVVIPAIDISDDGIDTDGNTVDDPTDLEVQEIPGATDLTIIKTTPLSEVLRGSTVPYTIIVSNNDAMAIGVVDVVDLLPSGFFFVDGSGAVNGTPVVPDVSGRQVVFADISVPPLGTATVTLSALITTGVLSGEHINFADVVDPDGGNPLAPTASATVIISPEPVFDCGELVGKVFDDRNGDGYQNQGEPGLPNVRLAGVDGVLITTDEFGRYSFPCAMLPSVGGSNFILKLDTRTLPSGYRLTTENPRVIRLTRGKVSKMNFGASITQLVRIDLSQRAFAPDNGSGVSPQLATAIDGMLAQIAQQPSMIRLSYHRVFDGDRVELRRARRQMQEVEQYIRRHWRTVGNYKLTIEKLYVRDQ